MNLIRIIAIALIVYLVIQIFKRWVAKKNSVANLPQEKEMVRCEVCQLHIPIDEALKNDEVYFCSQEHLDNKKD